MFYSQPPLELTATHITDAHGTIAVDDLPDVEPQCGVRLAEATPIMERLWRIALADIERNIVRTANGRYFGAGAAFGVRVYTRDICYSGILGLNALYPEIMLDSIRLTRQLRLQLGFRVSRGYSVEGIAVPWMEEDVTESDYLTRYGTNSYTRRTDDVVWLWCAGELLKHWERPDLWEWFYTTGQKFISEFYEPFFDPEDGLYRGQSSFIDIHFADHKATGYPRDWSIGDCVRLKSLSTNCLYVLGFEAMAQAAAQLNRDGEAGQWNARRAWLCDAIRRQMGRPDGTIAYFKDQTGRLQERREALGCALLVLSGVVTGAEARNALKDYPVTDGGVPLFWPFFPENDWYHNNSSWPFVDTFFLRAWETVDGIDRTALNAALLARTCIGKGTFHEVTDYRTREVKGSGSQLWTAAAFVDTCRRAGLVKLSSPAANPFSNRSLT